MRRSLFSRTAPRIAGPVAGLSLIVLTLTAAPLAAPAAGAASFRFVNVAAEAGLTRVVLAGRPGKDHLLDSAGTGAAWLDYDRDGRLDIYIVNDWKIEGSQIVERGRNALYRGLPGGKFEDVTDRAGVDGNGEWGAAATVADYDADGWPDILVTNFGKNVLYRNRGDGTFENVAAQVGLESPGWNAGASFFDADGDGDLDLYVAGYIDCTLQEVLDTRPSLVWKGLVKVATGPFGLKGAPDHFFLSEGGRKFVEATESAGLTDRTLAFGFGVRAADFDDDGDIDIYVANDSDANYLYRNDGKGHFDEVGVWAGCALDGKGAAQAGMGTTAGDYNGDGILDILVTNFAEDFTTLYKGIGDNLFEDVTVPTGIGPTTYQVMSWGTALADLDNDGDLDIVIANGHIYPQVEQDTGVMGHYEQKPILLENRDGTFVNVSDQAGPGFQIVQSSRAVAVGDYDDDGDLDILMTALDKPPALLRNESRTGSWLTIVAEVPPGKGPLIGTQITVTAGGRKIRRDIAAGDSYMSTPDPRAHFGLGTAEKADSVDVRWPDGTHSIVQNVPARQFLKIAKGS